MRRSIIACLLTNVFLLAGCNWMHPYQPDVQQGNLVSKVMVEHIKPGMSKEQIRGILGDPVLVNTFDANHWGYVYTFQHNGGEITRKNLDIYFQNNRVKSITQSEGKIS